MHGIGGSKARVHPTKALVLGIVLVLVGCSPWADDSASPDVSAEVSRSEDAVVSVRVDGAVSFVWEREVPLRIVKVTPQAREGHLVSVGIETPVSVSDDREQFRFAFDLVGGYDGPGTYRISGSQDSTVVGFPEDDPTTSSLISTAFLIYMQLLDTSLAQPYTARNYALVHAFSHVHEPCMVEVGIEETTGLLSCPELGDEDGNTISLEASWRLDN